MIPNRLPKSRSLIAAIVLSIAVPLTAQSPAAVQLDRAYSHQLSRAQLQAFALQALQSAYPDCGFRLDGSELVFANGHRVPFDDGQTRSTRALLESPTVFDMFYYQYPKTDPQRSLPSSILYPQDPGRIRSELFFKALYGSSQAQVRQNLVPIKWLPTAHGGRIWVSKINGLDKALQAVSDELDKQPELWPYLLQPGGTFNWRPIAGTTRLSVHSFGAAIDINVAHANYWRDSVKDETSPVAYVNRIPLAIVAIFAKHGFIWGGWWYHFDTMHFEYRPELLAYTQLVEAEIATSKSE